ncbi:MAG: hypothetical protein R2749_24375 [Acidimicrobiales bacterium]
MQRQWCRWCGPRRPTSVPASSLPPATRPTCCSPRTTAPAEVSGRTITIDYDRLGRRSKRLLKFGAPTRTPGINQKPWSEGQRVVKGDLLADGPSIDHGEIGLGKNLLVAKTAPGGYNFEDAIILSERMVKDDVLTSIHIHEHEIDAWVTPSSAPRRSPGTSRNLSEEILADLDERGIIRIGAEVAASMLVGNTPKGETESPRRSACCALPSVKAREVRDTS